MTAHSRNGLDAIAFNVNGLSGHAGHPEDIIPPNSSMPGGLNWTNDGKITYIANCAPLPPGETLRSTRQWIPPVVTHPSSWSNPPVDPSVDPPSSNRPSWNHPSTPPVVPAGRTVAGGPAGRVQHRGAAPVRSRHRLPPAATVQTPAATGAAAVSQGTNQGFNAQTAVGGTESAPTWLAGLGVMLGAGAVVAIRRRSAGTHRQTKAAVRTGPD